MPGTDRGGSSLGLRAVAHEGYAAAIVGSAFPNTYPNTLQADALTLVAVGLQSDLAVEGDLPEHGLAACGDDLLLVPTSWLAGSRINRETAKDLGAVPERWPWGGKRKAVATGAGGAGAWETPEAKRQPGNPDAPP